MRSALDVAEVSFSAAGGDIGGPLDSLPRNALTDVLAGVFFPRARVAR